MGEPLNPALPEAVPSLFPVSQLTLVLLKLVRVKPLSLVIKET